MKYMAIPASVAVENLFGRPVADAKKLKTRAPGEGKEIEPEEQLVINFFDFAIDRLADLAFARTGKGVLVAVAIREALFEAKKTGVLALEDQHVALFQQACESPSQGPDGTHPYHTGLALNLAPFLRAVAKIGDDKPTPGFVATPNEVSGKADEKGQGT